MLPALLATKVAKSNALAAASSFGFFSVILIGTFLLIRRLIRGFRKDGYMNSFGTNTAKGRSVQYATQLHQAMMSTPGWFNSVFGDGTDEQRIFTTAAEIQKDREVQLLDVQQAYKTMYNRDLIMDLTDELDSADFEKFRRILNTGLQGLELPSKLFSGSACKIYDRNFRTVKTVKAGVKLGTTYEKLITDRGTFDVFYYQGQPRLINSNYSKLLPNAA